MAKAFSSIAIFYVLGLFAVICAWLGDRNRLLHNLEEQKAKYEYIEARKVNAVSVTACANNTLTVFRELQLASDRRIALRFHLMMAICDVAMLDKEICEFTEFNSEKLACDLLEAIECSTYDEFCTVFAAELPKGTFLMPNRDFVERALSLRESAGLMGVHE